MLNHFSFLKDAYIRTAFFAAVGVIALSFVLVYRFAARVHHLLVIHFDRFRSINFLGSTNDLLSIWIVGLIVAIVNTLFVGFWYRRDKVVARILAFVTLMFQGLILLALGVIMSVN